MGLETSSFINDLVSTNPVGATDNRSEGDDHIRNLKTAIKATFPGFAGAFGRVQAKGSAYTAVLNDNYTMLNATSTWTLTLTAAATLGNGWSLLVYNGGAGVITVDPDGVETINGAATLAIAAGRIARIRCDGTNFIAIISLISDTYVLNDEAANMAELVTFAKGIGPSYLQNIRVAPSTAAAALTIALKGNDGNDPSATNVVEWATRSRTLGDGDYVIHQKTAAHNIIIPQGATMGFAADEVGFIHVYLCDDGIDQEFGVAATPLFGMNVLHTTTNLTVNADDNATLYTVGAMTNASIRYVCTLAITMGAVAGDWDNDPTNTHGTDRPPISPKLRQLFLADGTFIVPQEVYEIEVELWGGGAGGGGGASGGLGGGGGGGGAYVYAILTVVPGATYTVVIGAAGGAGAANGDGVDGGDSTFGTSLLTANGGDKGIRGATTGNGGLGGTASGGDLNADGTTGGAGNGRGNGGGHAARGGCGGKVREESITGAGEDGNAPGGGGGGGVIGFSVVGGAGSLGMCLVRW